MSVISGMIKNLGQEARLAASDLSRASSFQIDAVLGDLAALLQSDATIILQANQKDIESAAEKKLSPALLDRLTLTTQRIEAMAEGVLAVKALDDPCGNILEEWTRPNGLRFQKISVPIGVLGMIYESRPNVTIDAASLALKSRNAIILRGGSESLNSSIALHDIISLALKKNGLSANCVCMVTDQDRALVGDMLNAIGLIDVIIPRGGKGLTSRVMNESKVPVFAHLDGNCHVYVHSTAKPELALSVIKNAKLRRTGICGAVESLLFDSSLDDGLATDIISMLLAEGVEIVGDERAQALSDAIKPATEDDWSTEYLDKKISIRYVENVRGAIDHINHYGSHHTESILAEDESVVSQFLNEVDSAIVMHNTSTQFADGGEFGFGAEIGIGTGKLHARGPVGVKQLTTFKYVVQGQGQIRA